MNFTSVGIVNTQKTVFLMCPKAKGLHSFVGESENPSWDWWWWWGVSTVTKEE